MPAISSFYGILILMHLTRKEHQPPHIHAYYGEYEATFKISDGELLYGTFSRKRAKASERIYLTEPTRFIRNVGDRDI